MVDTGLLDWAGRRRRVMSRTPGPRSAGSPATAGPIAVGEPANLTLVDPAAPRVVDPRELRRAQPQHAVRAAASCRAASSRPSCAAAPTVLDGELA